MSRLEDLERAGYTFNEDGSWKYPEEFQDAQDKHLLDRVGFLDNHLWDRNSGMEWYEDGTVRSR